MTFSDFKAHSEPLFKKFEILKFKDNIVTGQLVVPSYNTTRYGLNSIYKKCIDSWNMITSEINKSKKMDSKINLFKMYSRNELKTTLTKHLFSVYMGS